MTPTLVFDWGDTLMVNFPQYDGPMVSWPEVAAVKDMPVALELLQESFHRVVATNAAASRSRHVRQALARVDLDRYFEAVFTAIELGARKPDPAFYTAIQDVLSQPGSQLIAIGDSYPVDILGAKQAGWKAVWFNPAGLSAPGLLPLHDAEVTSPLELPAALSTLTLPDYATCLTWMQEQSLPYNLMAHVHGVAACAYQMAVWLRAADPAQPVNPLLAHRGGLLHDLAKIKAMQRPSDQRIGHAELAGLMLKDRGQPELAEIVRLHGMYSISQEIDRPETWEQKLVFFADKIIEGSHLVSLDVRIAALRQRYPQDSDRIAQNAPALAALQEELCAAMHFPAAELIPRLQSALKT